MRTPISLIDLFVVVASSIVIGFHISGRIGSANPGIVTMTLNDNLHLLFLVMAASPALR